MHLLNLTTNILLKYQSSLELMLTHSDNLATEDLKQVHSLTI